MYCTNCGCNTHTFGKCSQAITSIGIIAYMDDGNDSLQFLLVKRKDTYGYVDFIRGKYCVNDIDYITMLFNIMTTGERESIIANDFDKLWCGLWRYTTVDKCRTDYIRSRDKFKVLKEKYRKHDSYSSIIHDIISSIDTNWIDQEWGFPKGRRNNRELPLECALREFSEETGYVRDDIKILTNVLPFEETFIGSNGKMYKNIYYVAKYEHDGCPIMDGFQRSEISDMKWLNEENIQDTFRPSDSIKINIIKKISRMLKENRLTTHYI